MLKKLVNWLLLKYNNFINPECYYMFTATYLNQNNMEFGTFYIKSRVLPSTNQLKSFVNIQIPCSKNICVSTATKLSDKDYKRFNN